MPSGVYKRTEKIKRSISNALKGRYLSEESRRKIGEAIKSQWKEGERKPAMLGKRHSEETKKKMSKSRLERKRHLGYINSSETRKKMSLIFKGRILSDGTKRKISEGGKIPRPWMRGKNSPHWKGGTSELSKRIKNSFKYKKWREAIFRRDNWTCQKCEKRGGIILHPHHKRSFASVLEENNIKTLEDALSCEVVWNINDGITLCRNCHKKTDTYGWNRYNEFRREQELKLPKAVAVK